MALEIRGQKLAEEGRWRHNTSNRHGHVVVFLCDIPYLTLLSTIIHPAEGYEVDPPQDIRLLQTWGVSELKYERSTAQFCLVS